MSFATCSVGRRAGHGLRYAQVVDVALGEAAIVVDDRDVVPRRQAQPNVDVAVVELLCCPLGAADSPSACATCPDEPSPSGFGQSAAEEAPP